MLQKQHGRNRPSRIVVTNRSVPRLEEIRDFHQRIGADIPLEYHHTPHPEATDAVLATLPPGSLIINATGLGKDAPGSPLSDRAVWPDRGIAWDFNYRGDLLFLSQARAQPAAKQSADRRWLDLLSFTAGRGSSPKCFTSTFPPAGRISTNCRGSRPTRGPNVNSLRHLAAVKKGTNMQIKPTTSLMEPFGVQFDLAAGIMLDPHDHIVRCAADMRGYYADGEALERLIAEQE